MRCINAKLLWAKQMPNTMQARAAQNGQVWHLHRLVQHLLGQQLLEDDAHHRVHLLGVRGIAIAQALQLLRQPVPWVKCNVFKL